MRRRAILLGLTTLALVGVVMQARPAPFSAAFSRETAYREHRQAWTRLKPALETRGQLETFFERHGGQCYFRSDDPRTVDVAAICVVDRSGDLPMFFVAHRWACDFDQPGDEYALRGCKRQSGSF